jgi:hypothetical protein
MRPLAFSRPVLLAALAVAASACLMLGVRIVAQMDELSALRVDTGLREQLAAQNFARAGAPLGRPLMTETALTSAADQLGRQLAGLGFRVIQVRETGRSPAGEGVQLTHLSVDAAADAPAVDRLGRWLDRNASGAALERLSLKTTDSPSATAAAHVELAALVAAKP